MDKYETQLENNIRDDIKKILDKLTDNYILLETLKRNDVCFLCNVKNKMLKRTKNELLQEELFKILTKYLL